ncbi:MAG TPA: response regulator transcription factor [Bacteroidetes bacterium]|nr:response regulator transcription factor [Bacteroidota bacterium]
MAAPDTDAPTVLLVDDEPDLVELLQYTLEQAGYRVLAASNGKDGLRLAETERPDVAVLDIMMPEMDGIELTQRLREDAQLRLTPIILLTARVEESDEIAGLDAGADDYVTKPVSPKKLVSRVRAMIRRQAREDEASTAQLRVHDLLIDRERYVVERPDSEESFKLPRKEFELVYFLASHPDRVFTRAELLDSVWGPDVYVVDRTVDVHVRKVREKLGSHYIETVKGVGYKMVGELAA